MSATTPFSSTDLEYAFGSIATLLQANLTPAESLPEMKELQPQHAVFWAQAATKAASGRAFHECLKPVLSREMYVSLRAADQSGKTLDTLRAMREELRERKGLRALVNELIYPSVTLLIGIGVSIFILAFVVPNLGQLTTQPGRKPKGVLTAIGMALQDALLQNYVTLLVLLAGGAVTAYLWWQTPSSRETALAALDRLPRLGPALRALAYSHWARHMAIVTQAGLTVLEALESTLEILPQPYRAELDGPLRDLVARGPALAFARRPGVDDPRNSIPFLIVNAFRLTERTGLPAPQFENASTALLEQGKQHFGLFVGTIKAIATTLIVGSILGSIMPYFFQIAEVATSIK